MWKVRTQRGIATTRWQGKRGSGKQTSHGHKYDALKQYNECVWTRLMQFKKEEQ
jgi:hypothetical protein